MDDLAGGFPVYPTGLKEINGKANPVALAQGQRLVLAPEDTERRVSIQSASTPLELYDGRGKAQNGWFVVRSKIPANKTGVVIEWKIDAATVKKLDSQTYDCPFASRLPSGTEKSCRD